MSKLYLITGATGHVGTVLVDRLMKRHENIRALVLNSDTVQLPSGIDICCGDIRDRNSLLPFFQHSEYDDVTLIHCAAFITVATKYNPAVCRISSPTKAKATASQMVRFFQDHTNTMRRNWSSKR